MSYICGVDVGGTFTDCVVVDDEGRVEVAKSPSTPDDFSRGILDSMAVAARRLEIEPGEFYPQVEALFHGTTVATNSLVERKGAKASLITTSGHGDALRIMRGAGRTAGLAPQEYLQFSRAQKPEPIIPRRLIGEVHERIDAKGQVVVELNEDQAREEIRRLLAEEVESISVCLLWSFKNPMHELRIGELIAEEGGEDVYTTLSHQLIPKWGEYERTAGTAINGFIGPKFRDYITELQTRLADAGMTGRTLIMQASGGLVDAPKAPPVAIRAIGSGPVAGITGSSRFGERVGTENILCTDMGGTTFDVGMVINGQAARTDTTIVTQYQFSLPQVNVTSIGAGGGSIASVDPVSKELRVGPESAGAYPGPAAYDQSGTEATVTDADVVLGYIDPDHFLGGEMKLNRSRSEQAIDSLAEKLGMSRIELAAGIVRIVETQMAELIRQTTVQHGHDPRDFVVYAYGGAGPTHGVGYAAELGAQSVIIPLLDLGAVWSAYGVASTDVVELVEQTNIMRQPFELEAINQSLTELERAARQSLHDQGVPEDAVKISRRAALRYTAQINQVEVGLAEEDLDDRGVEKMVEDFQQRYEQLYGKGSGFPGAGIELVTLSVEASGRSAWNEAAAGMDARVGVASEVEERVTRDVYWPHEGRSLETRIVIGDTLKPDEKLDGPVIAELPHTNLVIPPGFAGRIDEFGNCVIEL